MAKYFPVIGMEIHAELHTQTKMFCTCVNGLGLEGEPNIHICPVCTGQPGALPVPNRAAITMVQRVGLALSCELRRSAKFDRKNYFYPDLPKGYQISQYDEPFCERGRMEIDGKSFHVTRIHLEEDTGKLVHPAHADFTLVDFNRAGVPLMELVTEPDFANGRDARVFCERLRQILRYLDVSDADMEKGQMRCEVNISLYREGADRLSGTKVEIKNLNSFKSVEAAAAFEIKRQTELLETGGKIVQETRGFDEVVGETFSQRKKESAHDYRYFPEPDIPPFRFSEDEIIALQHSLPELPLAKQTRFVSEYGLPHADAVILTADKPFASFFERVASELREKEASGELTTDSRKAIRLADNYLLTEVRKYLKGEEGDITRLPITPENFAEFIALVAHGEMNSSAAQAVLHEMYHGGDNDPSHILKRLDLGQVNDTEALNVAITAVLAMHEKSVTDYRAGRENAFQYLIGQVMKETKGKANPAKVAELLKKKLAG